MGGQSWWFKVEKHRPKGERGAKSAPLAALKAAEKVSVRRAWLNRLLKNSVFGQESMPQGASRLIPFKEGV
jgi:hypothetical protein